MGVDDESRAMCCWRRANMALARAWHVLAAATGGRQSGALAIATGVILFIDCRWQRSPAGHSQSGVDLEIGLWASAFAIS
jgi:hypothetical protein